MRLVIIITIFLALSCVSDNLPQATELEIYCFNQDIQGFKECIEDHKKDGTK